MPSTAGKGDLPQGDGWPGPRLRRGGNFAGRVCLDSIVRKHGHWSDNDESLGVVDITNSSP